MNMSNDYFLKLAPSESPGKETSKLAFNGPLNKNKEFHLILNVGQSWMDEENVYFFVV